MKLNDEERAWLQELQKKRAAVGGEEPHIFESGFAAGIAYAQSQQSAMLAAERAAVVEECAKVCDNAVCVYNSNEQDMLAKQCAFLIRKLGEKR